MIQVNRIYLIFNRLVTKKFLVDTSVPKYILDAILFAKFEFSKELLVQMIGYVLGTYKESKKINNLKNKLKSYDEGDISFDDIKKSLEEVLNKNEPILYILNHL